ncbi:uncharacterized protein LOC111700869 [Eurytemora carolleeae]|uniref:uncharacterized protein LOC111700869 n=1 Tax=Eurytemora carolleeae TaxID=1294199 RepID=UPI000C759545|nr:uncharacterized protein LOC111700869 [Eurytemora carolleeae]|eukprot:XP_023327696.1 uncharacterized protein LOC111700869 [Eurytemora affinis]
MMRMSLLIGSLKQYLLMLVLILYLCLSVIYSPEQKINTPKLLNMHSIRQQDSVLSEDSDFKDNSQHILSNSQDNLQHILSNSQDNSVQFLSNIQENSRQILSNNQNNSRNVLSDNRKSLEQKMSKSQENLEQKLSKSHDSYKNINTEHTIKLYQTSAPFLSKKKDNFQPILSPKKESPEQVVSTAKDSSGKNLSAKKDSYGQIWASMGLCYNKNVQEMGKARYPYKEVTPLALLLWRYFLPEVRTIVRIIYTTSKIGPMMEEYGKMLKKTGAIVEFIPECRFRFK